MIWQVFTCHIHLKLGGRLKTYISSRSLFGNLLLAHLEAKTALLHIENSNIHNRDGSLEFASVSQTSPQPFQLDEQNGSKESLYLGAALAMFVD